MLFALKLDGPLLIGLALVAVYGLIVLYSASGQSMATVLRTVARLALGTVAMLLLAQVNPNFLRRSTPWLYAAGCVLLLIVVDASATSARARSAGSTSESSASSPRRS